MSNWENPLRGTPDLVEEVFANVLDTCAKGNADKYSDLLNSLWLSNLNNVSWLSKSKYPPMVVLLPRIGVEKVSCTKRCSSRILLSSVVKEVYLSQPDRTFSTSALQ